MKSRGLLLAMGLAALTSFAWSVGWAQEDAASLIQKGEAEWLLRSQSDDHAKAALSFFEKAAAADPKSAEALYKIARGCYFLGRFAPAGQKDALFQKGIDAGKKAVAADSKSAGAHYWYAAVLAKSLENKSITQKLKAKGEIEAQAQAALKLDPSFYFGGPNRLIGMLLYKSPVASNKDAIKNLRASLNYKPDYSLTLVSLAEVLIAEKQYDEAKKMCDSALAAKPMPGFERETADDQALAKKLLASIPAK
jgi:hypothetical protein